MHQQLLFAPLYPQIQANELMVESHLPSYTLTPDHHHIKQNHLKLNLICMVVLEEANLTRVLILLFS
jgi:hypothetical protein